MGSEAKRIQEQLERSFTGTAWHGPSVMELLADVDAAKAATHSIEGVHSIWELALHIAAWNKGAARRLSGDRAELSDEENFPAVNDIGDEDWRRTLELLRSYHRELHDAIGDLDDARLDQPILEGMSSVYVTLHGVVQHNLYHAGQIALLKKA
ncbi:MAG: DinB family protein [Acidobacteria bacterium]|nr:DinB family protein [Acidobacteriota bacterium]